jgi:hypothetical protein
MLLLARAFLLPGKLSPVKQLIPLVFVGSTHSTSLPPSPGFGGQAGQASFTPPV